MGRIGGALLYLLGGIITVQPWCACPYINLKKVGDARIEYRATDPAANPYLACACLLAAGLDGIEKEMKLPLEAEDDVWRLSDAERRAQGIPALPLTLEEAIGELRQSEFMAKVLGEEVYAYVLRNKEREWREYSAQITRGELAKFLRV